MVHVQVPPLWVIVFLEHFQRIMSDMLRGINGVEVVVDDLLIWRVTEEQHGKHLKKL